MTGDADARGAAAEVPAKEPAKPGAHSRLATADEQVTRWRDVIDKMRSRTDLTAKSLGALGSTVIGAVGIAKFADVFPFYDGWDWPTVLVAIATIIGFTLVAVALAAITIRLAGVSAPVFASKRLEGFDDVDTKEQDLIRKTFEDMADVHGAASLEAFEARGRRLYRIAERTRDSDRRKVLEDRAAIIRAEVLATQGRAAADVLRRRVSRALTDGAAMGWYAAAIIGVIMFAVGADYLDGERNGRDAIAKAQIANDKERVAIAKECAAVEKAYADQQLTVTMPDACETSSASGGGAAGQQKSDTAADAEAGALTDLTTRYSACRTAAKATNEADPVSCRKILQLINQLSGP
jgi:hypothetical protein